MTFAGPARAPNVPWSVRRLLGSRSLGSVIRRATAQRTLAGLIGAVVSLLAARRADALEGEPALLAGAGVEHWNGEVASTALATELGASYGLGEWLDIRAIGTISRLELCGGGRAAGPCGNQTWELSLGGMLAFKLDVIQWVPYLGPQLSYRWLTGGPIPREDRAHEFGVGGAFGIDYVPAREYGLGLQMGYQAFATALAEGIADQGALTAGLHFEYRWGW